MLTDEEKRRYHRHLILPKMGEEGQERIKSGKVLIIGTGGLGSPVALYLAAAGVGTIGLIDADTVDISNLQRQVIHHSPDQGEPKVESAKAKMKAINPYVEIRTYQLFFQQENADQLVQGYDIIVDCTDNYTAKFLINDVCVRNKKPFSHGSVLSWEGQVMTYVPGTATYRDVYPAPPEDGAVPTAAQVGILGAIPGIIGSIQATEVLKFLSGTGELLTNQLMIFDALTMRFVNLRVSS